MERRIKVLTEEGVREYGELSIPHSRQLRLSNLEGRTVSPDGKVTSIDKDAVFERRSSRQDKLFETAVAFPSVEPGAILDLSYDLYFDSIYYLEPWLFQNVIPTLHSEITYHIPETTAVGSWGQALPGKPFQQDVKPEKDGQRLVVWLDDIPAVPDEPFSMPLVDLSAKFMVVPHYRVQFGQRVPLMETWKELMDAVWEQLYKPALASDKEAKKKAKEIAAGIDKEKGERALAEALYEYVRDEIRTNSAVYSVLWVDEKKGVSKVVERKVGSAADKALLLHAMLDAEKIDSALVWVPDKDDGRIDPAVASPYWFERVLVRVDLDDGPVFLDPSSPSLAFNRLRPVNEGQPAVVADRKKPETVNLPKTPFSDHQRMASLDLTVDEEGRVTGSGQVTFAGHHAHRALAPGLGADEVKDLWTKWLEESYVGYDVSDVEVTQTVASQTVEVRFQVAQREDEVLGDEASVFPSRPLGPLNSPFELPPERRKTPVQLSFGDRDQSTTTLTWPEGWDVEDLPAAFEQENLAGAAVYEVATDEEARKMTVTRRLDVRKELFVDSKEYGALQTLWNLMETQDARPVVLVRR